MKYELIAPIREGYSTVEQILENRGIPRDKVNEYLNTTDEVISSPLAFGEENLKEAAVMILNAIDKRKSVLIVVDCDCDGFTSSALLANYLYSICPSFVESSIDFYMHEGKQHGLSDCLEVAMTYDLVICPDSSSEDYEQHKSLKESNIDVLVLDHHEAKHKSEYACIINNQLSDYPNKHLSGVGVTWQFCRYLDSLLGKDCASKYYDLVALGLIADMMSLLSRETKHLILKGLKEDYLKNPFIVGMSEKNSYSLGSKLTPMGVAFYIAPFVNAICRSGTHDEKELVFNSMLTHKAFNEIPSTKRGHKLGEMETVLAQALRTCTNVKNRQTREQDKGIKILEEIIEEQNLLDNKVLLFLLEPAQVQPEVRGLIANKFMAKYQRPCCVLTRVEEKDDNIMLLNNPSESSVSVSYQGSARGYDKSGVVDFKGICENASGTLYAKGHPGAFGLGLDANNIDEFIQDTNSILQDMSSEPIYNVDYIYQGERIEGQNILDIADLSELWGKDMDEPYVAIENLQITKDMVTLMSRDRNPTLKITLPNGVSILKFGSNEDEYLEFYSDRGYKKFNIIGRCQKNVWNGYTTPQIIMEEYEKTGESRYVF